MSARVARPPPQKELTERQQLIGYGATPSDVVEFATSLGAVPEASRADVVVEFPSLAALEEQASGVSPTSRARHIYALVVDRPGDMTALYKAVAISLGMRPPPGVEGRVADRRRGATGWLYDIVRLESGASYTRLHSYIQPELYDV